MPVWSGGGRAPATWTAPLWSPSFGFDAQPDRATAIEPSITQAKLRTALLPSLVSLSINYSVPL